MMKKELGEAIRNGIKCSENRMMAGECLNVGFLGFFALLGTWEDHRDTFIYNLSNLIYIYIYYSVFLAEHMYFGLRNGHFLLMQQAI
jgi:hypothetical protein